MLLSADHPKNILLTWERIVAVEAQWAGVPSALCMASPRPSRKQTLRCTQPRCASVSSNQSSDFWIVVVTSAESSYRLP